jgi:hypothetical protein
MVSPELFAQATTCLATSSVGMLSAHSRVALRAVNLGQGEGALGHGRAEIHRLGTGGSYRPMNLKGVVSTNLPAVLPE